VAMSERRANGGERPNGNARPQGLERLAGLADRVIGDPKTIAVMAFVSVASFLGSLVSEAAQVLLINVITILTYLLLFPLQHTQNRDSIAVHAKLDELLRANPQARKAFIGIEELAVAAIERAKETVPESKASGQSQGEG
jgi:low affinity Fe/Cu permease